MNATADLDALDSLDVIVLGGGPAGSAAAIELALGSKRVVLVERTLEAHDKVCGDFLSGETIANLEALGVTPAALGAVAINRVRFAGALGVSSAKLPFAAQSLTRRTLDDALLRRASAAGALVLRGHSAGSLHRNGALWQVSIAGPDRSYALMAKHVVLATGKHDLRGLPRPAGVQPNLVGLKMYLRLTAAQSAELAGNIELVLLPGGYGGLSLVEDGAADLCFVLDRDVLRHTSRDWPSLLNLLTRTPHLRRRLAGARPLLARPLAISPIPYGFLRRDAIADGIFAVGDQTAVIPSFTGDGLAISLQTGRFSAQNIFAGASSKLFHVEQSMQLSRQISFATTISRALLTHPQRSVLQLAVRLIPSLLSTIAARTRSDFEAPTQFRSTEHKKTCAAA